MNQGGWLRESRLKTWSTESSGTGCAADVLVGRKREAQDRKDYERRVRPLALPLPGIRRHPYPRRDSAGSSRSPEAWPEAQAEGLTDISTKTQKSPPSAEDFLHSEGLFETGFHRD